MTALTTSTNGSKTSQGPKSVSGRLGKLCTRLAENENEIEKAQQVRYKVFCEELNASPATRNLINQRDEDRYDQHCDHLIMLDTSDHPATNIVGTQRFHVGDGTTPLTDFYSSGEFDVAGLLKRHPEKRFMELGRSCILPEYRSLRTMELLWHGTWQYALKNRADVMFGCASFYTTDPEEIAGELGFLSQIRVDEAWKVSSSRSDRIELDEYR